MRGGSIESGKLEKSVTQKSPKTRSSTSGKSATSHVPKAKEKRTPKSNVRKEIGGTKGPEPTRYGDWEHKGIASDF